ncbi:hypothetical protein J5N97_002814 [Dioscorea zingiberensis]|uniref:Uncharacterized protein n=1 Tax=Dioscorea zingiberensis TaxID=325984 RepID=A0A9D5D5H6_9LILI|nr:hypothetical protein J5N97_002814 [Dioscorea zingiberensis]
MNYYQLLLLTILLSSILSSSTAITEVVLDTDGNILKPGLEYYIRPAARDIAGGLIVASPNNSCPLLVGQARSGADLGYPVIFSPVNPDAETLNLGTDTNIQFQVITTCIQSNVWRLIGSEDDTGRYYVSTDGVKGNPAKKADPALSLDMGRFTCPLQDSVRI